MTTRMASDDDRLARLVLSKVFEPGDARVAELVALLGAERLLTALRSEQDVAGLLADASERLSGADDAHRDLDRADRLGIRWVVPGDDEWPRSFDDLDAAESLDRTGGAPLGVWVRGPLRLCDLSTPVAIVGARSATTYGEGAAAELAAGVARAGSAVISGAAYGIDQAAHRGALAARGETVAVLACGADRVYPSAHRELLAHLAEHGAIVAEVGLGCAPMRQRFLSRNRLIAALARGTVVVEAAARSGAINTAGWTSRLARPLMAVPGPLSSATSEGTHQLIRDGAATLVTRGEHVLEAVAPMGEHTTERVRGTDRPRDRLSAREQRLLEAVPVSHPAPVESVARTAGIGAAEVQQLLVSLARGGWVEQFPTGYRLADGAGAE
jgi:DNA processing protein